MEYLQREDLEVFIEQEPEPDQSLKLQWTASVIDTVSHFHQCHQVLIFDITLRSLLIADDLTSLKMIDFWE